MREIIVRSGEDQIEIKNFGNKSQAYLFKLVITLKPVLRKITLSTDSGSIVVVTAGLSELRKSKILKEISTKARKFEELTCEASQQFSKK